MFLLLHFFRSADPIKGMTTPSKEIIGAKPTERIFLISIQIFNTYSVWNVMKRLLLFNATFIINYQLSFSLVSSLFWSLLSGHTKFKMESLNLNQVEFKIDILAIIGCFWTICNSSRTKVNTWSAKVYAFSGSYRQFKKVSSLISVDSLSSNKWYPILTHLDF